MTISSKPYRCINCHNEFNTSTNHYGEIYGCSPFCRAKAEWAVNPDGSVKSASGYRPVKKGVKEVERMLKKVRVSGNEKFVVKYGFHYLQGNRRPYFSMTVDIYEKKKNNHWYESGGGAAYDVVRKHFPELAHLIKWHLVGDDGTPRHYEANAIYHLELHHKVSKWDIQRKEPSLEHFKSTVVFGALESDSIEPLTAPLMEEAKREEIAKRVKEWCRSRLPALAAKMREELTAAGVPYIDPSEYMEQAS